MNPEPTQQKRKRRRTAWVVAAVFVVLGLVYEAGFVMECEYPFWPTLWVAEQTKTPDGKRVVDLIRSRSGVLSGEEHWHHCSWCDDVFEYAPHMAIKVTANNDEAKYLLFDWEFSRRRLLPLTVRTAKLFPELIPSGYVVQPLGNLLNRDDEACRIVVRETANP